LPEKAAIRLMTASGTRLAQGQAQSIAARKKQAQETSSNVE
jgi:hypothetical protein